MKLREWIHKEGMLVKEFADKIGYDPDYLSGMMNGTKKTTAKLIDKIKLITKGKVREQDWIDIVADPLKSRPKRKK